MEKKDNLQTRNPDTVTISRAEYEEFQANGYRTGQGNSLFLSAITSGGSQAVFWKINTMGEESFLDKVIELAESYSGGV